MPSPRASPALRPSSPLSPRFESSSRYESLHPQPSSSQRGLHPRSAAAASQRRPHNSNTAGGTLKLPGLPRFHPANFPSSQSSSAANTPGTGPNSGLTSPTQPPVSPKAQQRLYSEAQKQLYLYHRETLAAQAAVAATHAASRPNSSRVDKPLSPRLAPLGSPGPVTPLELEGQDGYLIAGAHAASAASHAAAAHAATKQIEPHNSELVDKLIQQEVLRNKELEQASQGLGQS